MAQFEINKNKEYHFPIITKVVRFDNKILVIATEYANWIVLDSTEQLSVLEFLKQGHTIQDCFLNSFKEDDINYVVCQIEARQLCNKQVHSSVEDERSMHLYLTNKCNLFCPHCYMYSGQKTQEELTTEQIKKLIYDYKTIANGTRLTISGGEPTIRSDFEQIIIYASKLGLNIKLLTNGALFSKTKVEKLSKYINSVQISIDGFSEESNALIRGKEHFKKALNTVEYFISAGVKTSVAITPSYALLKQYTDKYVIFAKELLEKYSNKSFCVKFAESLSSGRKINPTEEENEEYSNLVKIIQSKIYGLEYDLINFVQTISNDIITENCMFGVFAVASNGDVFLCPEIGKLVPVANIKNDDFSDILQEAIAAEKATSVNRLQPCKDCELRYICGGGCRIDEFPSIKDYKTFSDIQTQKTFTRKCNNKIKEKFYDLMIKSNEYLYKA